MMMAVLTTTTFYFVTVYTPTFGKTVLKLSTPRRPAGHAAGGGDELHLESGRRRAVRPDRPQAGAARRSRCLSLVTAYPALQLAGRVDPTFGKMLAVEMMFSFYFGVYSGTMLGALVEVVPAHVRTTCFSLAFALAAGAVRHLHAVCIDLADRQHRRQGISRILADVRRRPRHRRRSHDLSRRQDHRDARRRPRMRQGNRRASG